MRDDAYWLIWEPEEQHGVGALRAAGEWARGRAVAAETHKPGELGGTSSVTADDRALEALIGAYLNKYTPGIPVIGEEEGGKVPESGRCWVVDPIDGTYHYAHGHPTWGVQLCLVCDRRVVFGAILLPRHDRLFVAGEGRGAWRDGRRLHRTQFPPLERSALVVNTIRAGADPRRLAHQRFLLALFERTLPQLRTARITETMSADLSGVADGHYEIVVGLNNKPYDTGAGMLLCREAGLMLLDHRGEEWSMLSRAAVACPPEHADWLTAHLRAACDISGIDGVLAVPDMLAS